MAVYMAGDFSTTEITPPWGFLIFFFLMRKYKSSKCVTFFPNKLLPTFNLCDVIQYATFIILHIEIIFMMSKTKFTRLAQFPPPQKKKKDNRNNRVVAGST